jgi:MFS family permease
VADIEAGTSTPSNWISRLAPPPEVQRVLVVQTFGYSLGSGFYAAGSVIFFTVYAGLSTGQVAAVMSVVGAVALALRLPCGMLADRLGGRRAWMAGALAQAVMFGLYPFAHGLIAILVVASLAGVGASLGGSGRGRYLGEAIPSGRRVKANAYLRSVLNVGMALGTVGAGFLVAVHSHRAMAAIVLANAVGFLLDVVLLAFFIKAVPGGGPRKAKPSGRGALRDRPFLVLSALNGVFALSDVILTVVLPLWILRTTHAQRPLIPALLLVNMIMVTVLQVWASKNSEDVPGSVRVQRRAGLFMAGACVLIPFTYHSRGLVTWVVVLAAAVVMTLGELYSAASGWGLGYALSPDDRRGEYLAVFNWGTQFADIVGPAAITALAISFIPGGWLLIAAVFLAAAFGTAPTVAWLERSRSMITEQATVATTS